MPSTARFHEDARHAAESRVPLPLRGSAELSGLIDRARRIAAARPPEGPAQNPYALQPDSLHLLDALLDTLRPSRIVEFGSGASTAVFARWAAAHAARLFSVEHDRGWVNRVRDGLSAEERGVTSLRHAPLRLQRKGLRTFLTYGGLDQLAGDVAEAGLILVDGPHMSGREPVIRAVLARMRVGAVLVIDDCRHYATREILHRLDGAVTTSFVGVELDDNTHGLCILRCESPPSEGKSGRVAYRDVLRSYWRCLRDFRQHGTGA
jgi:predicted O-methyltransferase YrrM